MTRHIMPTANHRWYQFSLRSLLVFVTLFAIACSWIAVKMAQAKRQHEAVDSIIKLGGGVGYNYQYDSSDNWIIDAPDEPPGPAWIRSLIGDDCFRNVVSITIYEGNISNADLKYLQVMDKLHSLSICLPSITDDGILFIIINSLETIRKRCFRLNRFDGAYETKMPPIHLLNP
jgi:hypothetical protein